MSPVTTQFLKKVGFALCTRQADGMVMSVAALVYLVPISAARTLRFDVGLHLVG